MKYKDILWLISLKAQVFISCSFHSPQKGRIEKKVIRMDNNPDNINKTSSGAGIPIGAAIGFILGMPLFEEMIFGAGIGAALGLLIGAIIDTQMEEGTKN